MNEKICFIRAKKKKDYVFDGIKNSGFKIIVPYTDRNLFLRILRELWFRLKLPFRKLFFNSAVKNITEDIIIIKDPLMVPEFVKYLREIFPDKTIIFNYDNRVSMSLNPKTIKSYCDEIWSYDNDDCKEYDLRHVEFLNFLDVYQTNLNENPEYDVFYIGKDKGRMEKLMNIEKKLNEQGLKTYFHICADREFLRFKNKNYKKFIPYEEYLDILRNSRAVLNIVQEGQTSITPREIETVFDGIKCITNNKGIFDFKFYDKSRYFYIDENFNADDIKKFLDAPFKEINPEELKEYKFSNRVNLMLSQSTSLSNKFDISQTKPSHKWEGGSRSETEGSEGL